MLTRTPSSGAAALIILGYFAAPAAGAQDESSAAPPRPPADTAEAEEGQPAKLEEIVITARKVKESLQEVPLSVVAVSGEDLEQRSIVNLEALGHAIPNFTFSQQSNFGRVGGLAFIRGVGQRDATAAYDPAVGTYIDGVYMGRMTGNNIDLMDIERVEVLRGPQGTLFGKNTSGGAISIVTQSPDLSDHSGRLQLTTGSRDRFDALAGANLPLIADKLGLRIAASRNTQDGYGRRADNQEMADTDRSAARAQLLFQPGDGFSGLLAADWLEFDEANTAYKLVQVNPLAGPVPTYNALFDPDYNSQWLSASDYTNQATGSNSSRGNIWGASVTFNFDMAWATLKSISSYREIDVHTDIDPDGSPVVIIDTLQHFPQHQVSQELQLTGASFADRLSWVAGVYYFHENAQDRVFNRLLPALFGTSQDFTRVADIANESRAVYGQGTYSLTDRMRLTAGLRYTNDEKDIVVQKFGAAPFGPLSGNHDSSAVSPRLGLDYRWTPQVMTYASVAQGTRNGGFTGRPARTTDFVEFEDEKVWTYEIGLRSDLFGQRLRVNATAFYSRFENLQLQIGGSTTSGNPPVATPFALIDNIPKASIRGGELEVIFVPIPHLTLSGALGLTDARYDELPLDNARFATFVASGALSKETRFPNTPDTAFTLAAEYDAPLPHGASLTARLDYSHQSSIYYSSVERAANSTQPAYGLLNARLTFDLKNEFSIALFGTNLTDEAYFVATTDDAATGGGLGFSFQNMGAPREWGISLQKRF